MQTPDVFYMEEASESNRHRRTSLSIFSVLHYKICLCFLVTSSFPFVLRVAWLITLRSVDYSIGFQKCYKLPQAHFEENVKLMLTVRRRRVNL